jgi:hypothetical protein
MQIFLVKGDGEVHEILQESPIKDLLNSDESYILCDDEERIVYLWKGKNARVRSKFIGARKMQDVRSQVGLNYRSISLDEEDVNPNEYPEFVSAIENPRKDGFAKEIREEGEDLKFEVGGGPKDGPRVYAKLMNSKFNQNIEQTGPLYRGDDVKSVGSYADPFQTPSSKEMSQPELEKIIAELDESAIPEGYTREMVIIGDKTYSETEKVQTFLGKKQIKRELELIDTLPEGVFLAEGYIPRLLVHDQIVIAIEFLKKKE